MQEYIDFIFYLFGCTLDVSGGAATSINECNLSTIIGTLSGLVGLIGACIAVFVWLRRRKNFPTDFLKMEALKISEPIREIYTDYIRCFRRLSAVRHARKAAEKRAEKAIAEAMSKGDQLITIKDGKVVTDPDVIKKIGNESLERAAASSARFQQDEIIRELFNCLSESQELRGSIVKIRETYSSVSLLDKSILDSSQSIIDWSDDFDLNVMHIFQKCFHAAAPDGKAWSEFKGVNFEMLADHMQSFWIACGHTKIATNERLILICPSADSLTPDDQTRQLGYYKEWLAEHNE